MKIDQIEFTIRCGEYGYATISWQDEKAGRKYHIWITDDYTIQRHGRTGEATVHSNPITPGVTGFRHRSEHRALDADAKKWKPIVDAALAWAKDGDKIATARQASKDAEAARIATEREARAEAWRKAFGEIPTDAGTDVLYLVPMLRSLTTDQLFTISAAFRAA
jgi:hypothetical protein